MKIVRILKTIRGLYLSLISIISIAILFLAAWITGNLPRRIESVTGGFDWHSTESDWGFKLNVLVLIPLLGIIEGILINAVEQVIADYKGIEINTTRYVIERIVIFYLNIIIFLGCLLFFFPFSD